MDYKEINDSKIIEEKSNFELINNHLNIDKINLGTSKLQLVENGVYVKTYRITIPKELNEYE